MNKHDKKYLIFLPAVLFLAVFLLSGCVNNTDKQQEKQHANQNQKLNQKVKKLEEKVANQEQTINEQEKNIESLEENQKDNMEIGQDKDSEDNLLEKSKVCDQVFYYVNQYKVKNRDNKYTNFVKCENNVVKCRDQKGWIRSHYENGDTFSDKDIDFILDQIEKDYQDYIRVKSLCSSK